MARSGLIEPAGTSAPPKESLRAMEGLVVEMNPKFPLIKGTRQFIENSVLHASDVKLDQGIAKFLGLSEPKVLTLKQVLKRLTKEQRANWQANLRMYKRISEGVAPKAALAETEKLLAKKLRRIRKAEAAKKSSPPSDLPRKAFGKDQASVSDLSATKAATPEERIVEDLFIEMNADAAYKHSAKDAVANALKEAKPKKGVFHRTVDIHREAFDASYNKIEQALLKKQEKLLKDFKRLKQANKLVEKAGLSKRSIARYAEELGVPLEDVYLHIKSVLLKPGLKKANFSKLLQSEKKKKEMLRLIQKERKAERNLVRDILGKKRDTTTALASPTRGSKMSPQKTTRSARKDPTPVKLETLPKDEADIKKNIEMLRKDGAGIEELEANIFKKTPKIESLWMEKIQARALEPWAEHLHLIQQLSPQKKRKYLDLMVELELQKAARRGYRISDQASKQTQIVDGIIKKHLQNLPPRPVKIDPFDLGQLDMKLVREAKNAQIKYLPEQTRPPRSGTQGKFQALKNKQAQQRAIDLGEGIETPYAQQYRCFQAAGNCAGQAIFNAFQAANKGEMSLKQGKLILEKINEVAPHFANRHVEKIEDLIIQLRGKERKLESIRGSLMETMSEEFAEIVLQKEKAEAIAIKAKLVDAVDDLESWYTQLTPKRRYKDTLTPQTIKDLRAAINPSKKETMRLLDFSADQGLPPDSVIPKGVSGVGMMELLKVKDSLATGLKGSQTQEIMKFIARHPELGNNSFKVYQIKPHDTVSMMEYLRREIPLNVSYTERGGGAHQVLIASPFVRRGSDGSIRTMLAKIDSNNPRGEISFLSAQELSDSLLDVRVFAPKETAVEVAMTSAKQKRLRPWRGPEAAKRLGDDIPTGALAKPESAIEAGKPLAENLERIEQAQRAKRQVAQGIAEKFSKDPQGKALLSARLSEAGIEEVKDASTFLRDFLQKQHVEAAAKGRAREVYGLNPEELKFLAENPEPALEALKALVAKRPLEQKVAQNIAQKLAKNSDGSTLLSAREADLMEGIFSGKGSIQNAEDAAILVRDIMRKNVEGSVKTYGLNPAELKFVTENPRPIKEALETLIAERPGVKKLLAQKPPVSPTQHKAGLAFIQEGTDNIGSAVESVVKRRIFKGNPEEIRKTIEELLEVPYRRPLKLAKGQEPHINPVGKMTVRMSDGSEQVFYVKELVDHSRSQTIWKEGVRYPPRTRAGNELLGRATDIELGFGVPEHMIVIEKDGRYFVLTSEVPGKTGTAVENYIAMDLKLEWRAKAMAKQLVEGGDRHAGNVFYDSNRKIVSIIDNEANFVPVNIGSSHSGSHRKAGFAGLARFEFLKENPKFAKLLEQELQKYQSAAFRKRFIQQGKDFGLSSNEIAARLKTMRRNLKKSTDNLEEYFRKDFEQVGILKAGGTKIDDMLGTPNSSLPEARALARNTSEAAEELQKLASETKKKSPPSSQALFGSERITAMEKTVDDLYEEVRKVSEKKIGKPDYSSIPEEQIIRQKKRMDIEAIEQVMKDAQEGRLAHIVDPESSVIQLYSGSLQDALKEKLNLSYLKQDPFRKGADLAYSANIKGEWITKYAKDLGVSRDAVYRQLPRFLDEAPLSLMERLKSPFVKSPPKKDSLKKILDSQKERMVQLILVEKEIEKNLLRAKLNGLPSPHPEVVPAKSLRVSRKAKVDLSAPNAIEKLKKQESELRASLNEAGRAGRYQERLAEYGLSSSKAGTYSRTDLSKIFRRGDIDFNTYREALDMITALESSRAISKGISPKLEALEILQEHFEHFKFLQKIRGYNKGEAIEKLVKQYRKRIKGSGPIQKTVDEIMEYLPPQGFQETELISKARAGTSQAGKTKAPPPARALSKDQTSLPSHSATKAATPEERMVEDLFIKMNIGDGLLDTTEIAVKKVMQGLDLPEASLEKIKQALTQKQDKLRKNFLNADQGKNLAKEADIKEKWMKRYAEDLGVSPEQVYQQLPGFPQEILKIEQESASFLQQLKYSVSGHPSKGQSLKQLLKSRKKDMARLIQEEQRAETTLVRRILGGKQDTPSTLASSARGSRSPPQKTTPPSSLKDPAPVKLKTLLDNLDDGITIEKLEGDLQKLSKTQRTPEMENLWMKKIQERALIPWADHLHLLQQLNPQKKRKYLDLLAQLELEKSIQRGYTISDRLKKQKEIVENIITRYLPDLPPSAVKIDPFDLGQFEMRLVREADNAKIKYTLGEVELPGISFGESQKFKAAQSRQAQQRAIELGEGIETPYAQQYRCFQAAGNCAGQAIFNAFQAANKGEMSLAQGKLILRKIREVAPDFANRRLEKVKDLARNLFMEESETALILANVKSDRNLMGIQIRARVAKDALTDAVNELESWYTQLGPKSGKTQVTPEMIQELRNAIELSGRGSEAGLRKLKSIRDKLPVTGFQPHQTQEVMEFIARHPELGNNAFKAISLESHQTDEMMEYLKRKLALNVSIRTGEGASHQVHFCE